MNISAAIAPAPRTPGPASLNNIHNFSGIARFLQFFSDFLYTCRPRAGSDAALIAPHPRYRHICAKSAWMHAIWASIPRMRGIVRPPGILAG
jgi:hypothetical protein